MTASAASSREESGRWRRMDQIHWFDRGRLESARVVVVGLGAEGQPLAMHVVLNGIGNVLLMDRDDAIEPHNLPRSPLFSADDIGLPKARAAKRALQRLNPSCRIGALHADLEDIGQGLFRELRSAPSVVCGATDNRRARILLNELCYRWAIPYIDGGIDGASLTGTMRMFLADGPDSPCYECQLTPEAYEDAYRPNPCERPEGEGAPTLSTIAGTVAATMAAEAMKLLLGVGQSAVGHELFWDGMGNTFLSSELMRNPHCLFDHNVVQDALVTQLDEPNRVTLGEAYARAEKALGAGPVTLDVGREIEPARLPGAALAAGTYLLGAGEARRCPRATLAQLGVPRAEIIAARNESGEARYLQIGSARELWNERSQREWEGGAK